MQALKQTTMLAAALAALTAAASAQISLTGPITTATGQRVEAPVFADFNGDGILDMAITSNGTGNLDLVEVYSGNATGAFSLATTLFLANGSAPSGLAAADFDGDGDRDLVVSLKNVDQVRMLRNMGNFGFALQPAVAVGGEEPRQVSAADMDGDGDPDVVVSLRRADAVAVLLNQGGVLTLLNTFNGGAEVRDHAVGDFDQDGDMDVATASHDDRTVRVLWNGGNGTLMMGATLNVPPATRPAGLAAGDVDGDGDLDLAVAAGDSTATNANVVVLFMNSAGVFSSGLNLQTNGLDVEDVVLADFRGNGALDVAASNLTSGTIALFANQGAGSFGAASFLSTSPAPGDLVAADIDANGAHDLAVVGRQTSSVQVFLSAESGAPGEPYCSALPNSTGFAGRTRAFGSDLAQANNLTLEADRLPANVFGFFLVSQSQGLVAHPGGSQGNLCLGGALGRLNQTILTSLASGSFSTSINLASMPTPSLSVPVVAGQTWNFQCWYRDTVAGQPASNFTDGYSILFR